MTRMHQASVPMIYLVILVLFMAGCNLPLPAATPTSETPKVIRGDIPTSVGPTPTSIDPTLIPSDTPVPPTPVPPTPVPPTVTPEPPAGSISLNCDGTYQRLRLTNGGASGKTISVDDWDGSGWVNVWNIAGGDPMIRQIEDQAGYYIFGGCQKLAIVPMRYSGSGAILELGIHVWNGAGLTRVYFNEGVHGTWSKVGDNIIFEQSLYLYGEPNCCPCNRQTLQYTWDGTTFNQTGSAITPTYSGTPPPICVP